MKLDFDALTQTALRLITTVGLKVVGALIIWFAGRRAIRVAVTIVGKHSTGGNWTPRS
jgi:hypothetical protein